MTLKELKARLRLCFKILRSGSSSSHAERELASWYLPESDDVKPDDMNIHMANDLKDLLRVFATQGHSGFSAPFAVNLFSKLAKHEPLGPLTGEVHEWNEVAEDAGVTTLQNNRCSSVFKEIGDEGMIRAQYDIDGFVFEEPSGCRFTSGQSRRNINFPYNPKTSIVKVSDDASSEEQAVAIKAVQDAETAEDEAAFKAAGTVLQVGL